MARTPRGDSEREPGNLAAPRVGPGIAAPGATWGQAQPPRVMVLGGSSLGGFSDWPAGPGPILVQARYSRARKAPDQAAARRLHGGALLSRAEPSLPDGRRSPWADTRPVPVGADSGPSAGWGKDAKRLLTWRPRHCDGKPQPLGCCALAGSASAAGRRRADVTGGARRHVSRVAVGPRSRQSAAHATQITLRCPCVEAAIVWSYTSDAQQEY